MWVAEAYGFDSPSLMGYLAAKTETVEIGAAILPIYTRTPTLIAMTAAGIDALSDGRFSLGLGASGPQVIEGFHGVPYTNPLGRTREIIEICRDVWRREAPLVHDGQELHAAPAARARDRAWQAAQDHCPPAARRDSDLGRGARGEERRADRRGRRRVAAHLLHPRAGPRGLGRGAGAGERPSAVPNSAS